MAGGPAADDGTTDDRATDAEATDAGATDGRTAEGGTIPATSSADRTLRRVAIAATVVVVLVVVVLAVVVNVLGDPHGTGGAATPSAGPASVSGPSGSARGDAPPVQVQTPPVTPEAEATCPALMSTLPVVLAGEQSRAVQSDSPFAYAWGDPAIVLVCGVPVPAAFQPDSFVVFLNGVNWFVDTSDPTTTVYTSVDRTVPVQVRVPSSQDSATVVALGPLVDAAVPAVAPG